MSGLLQKLIEKEGEVMRSGVGVWPRVMKRENRRRREERELSGVLWGWVGVA
jgi:hypothetical protein